MDEPQYCDSPPMYSSLYSPTTQAFYPPASVHYPRSHYVPYTCSIPPDSYTVKGNPQHFYRCLSPPGFVKTFKGVTVFMCFVIFALVASTLVWELNGSTYGGSISGGGFMGTGYGYYSGTYSYASSYMTPMAAKAAMMAMAGINFVFSLMFLIWSISRTRISRGCRFYLTIFICDIILAILQGIIDIIFAIGVNPMAQNSQSMLYNPMLMMCEKSQGIPSISASLGGGFPAGFPTYYQHLHHYCYMDPEEVVALVLGLLVVLALSLSAFYAYKTRSKIWHHGKANILWDEPRTRLPEGQDVQDWVDRFEEPRSTQNAAVPSAPALDAENSVVSYSNGTVSLHSDGNLRSHGFYPNTCMGPRTEF